MANNLATVTNANMTFKNDTFNESRDGNDTGEGIDMARFENMFFTRTECKIVSAFLITCAILGSLLNFLVASVYIQKKSKCTYEIFILFLAFINLLGCCGVMCVDYWFVFSSYDSCREPPDFTTQVSPKRRVFPIRSPPCHDHSIYRQPVHLQGRHLTCKNLTR